MHVPHLLSRAHIGRSTFVALVAAVLVAQGSPAFAAGDADSDGTPDGSDCQPLNPAVAPGKTDKPDLAFEDTNCDGIDGDIAHAVFVSTAGSAGGLGSKDIP